MSGLLELVGLVGLVGLDGSKLDINEDNLLKILSDLIKCQSKRNFHQIIVVKILMTCHHTDKQIKNSKQLNLLIVAGT